MRAGIDTPSLLAHRGSRCPSDQFRGRRLQIVPPRLHGYGFEMGWVRWYPEALGGRRTPYSQY